MSAVPKQKWSPQAYLAFESESHERHELVDGDVYLMTGASQRHNLIVASVIITLGSQLLNRPCEVYPSDMLVKIAETGDYHYPDISVVCGQSQIIHDQRDILLNPTLIIEVLSPSTEQYDRSHNSENYRSLASLREYGLISQERPHIEHYVRQDQGDWLFSEAKDLSAALDLPSITCTLALRDVYAKVRFNGEAQP